MLMRKCQWIGLALVALCVVVPVPSWALGLGEIEVDSALNERFSGTIGLLDAEGFQPSEIVVSMASREDFERVGVERFFYLTNIKFDVRINGGVAEVVVSSSQPVSEPYLNFIVEVLWPNGRLLKEYTVLLDPPTFSQAAAPAVAAPSQPVAAAPAEPAAAPRRADAGTQVGLRRPPAARPTERRAPPPDGLMTTRDDTLWQIANRTRESERVSVNQQMLAIQRMNPEAFLRNNINLLKAGYVLELPSEAEALSVDNALANADVSDQMEAWRTGTPREQVASSDGATQLIDEQGEDLRSQVDATAATDTGSTRVTDAEGQVRIVANTGELASGTASGDDASVNQLLEEKEALTRQVDELTYQLDREKDIATNQVTVKDRQLEVKDAEIAQLQEQLRLAREAVAAQAEQTQNQSATGEAAADTPWYLSPMVLGSVIGALILALVGVLVVGRRNRGAEHEALDIDQSVDYEYEDNYDTADAVAEELDVADDVDDALDVATAVEPTIGEIELDADDHEDLHEGEDEIVALYEEEEEDAEQAAELDEDGGETQTGDVIGEAEIYIAYGRYGQAANLLSGVLANEPDRWDVRLKMLEVCVESHDMDAFSENAQYIVDNCEDEDVLMACRELETQMGDAHVDLSSDIDKPLEEVGSEDSSAAQADAEDDFDLDLDDLEVDTAEAASTADLDDTLAGADELPDAEDAPAAAGETAAPDEDEFELEFDTDTDASEAEESSLTATDELGGDLGFDFDPDRDVADDTEAAAGDEPEIDLDDLDLDAGDNLEVAEAGTTAEASTDTPAETAVDSSADEPAGEAPPVLESAGESDASDADDAGAEDFEFDTEADADVNATKLDLAEAYVDMGDADGAQDILNEVLEEGTPEQQEKAKAMLESMAG